MSPNLPWQRVGLKSLLLILLGVGLIFEAIFEASNEAAVTTTSSGTITTVATVANVAMTANAPALVPAMARATDATSAAAVNAPALVPAATGATVATTPNAPALGPAATGATVATTANAPAATDATIATSATSTTAAPPYDHDRHRKLAVGILSKDSLTSLLDGDGVCDPSVGVKMADGIMVPCAIGPLDVGKRDGQQFLKGSKGLVCMAYQSNTLDRVQKYVLREHRMMNVMLDAMASSPTASLKGHPLVVDVGANHGIFRSPKLFTATDTVTVALAVTVLFQPLHPCPCSPSPSPSPNMDPSQLGRSTQQCYCGCC
mmetsp:Transcript_14443/g.38049  ORF Transcript_14443/g.38049 Transcript_14443/m.38049 type:complete len:318 (+) Transcript_14443:121-1074(+)